MFHNFQEMEDYIKGRNIRMGLVLANAHDKDVLEAVVMAKRKGVIEPTLIGLEDRIKSLLDEMGEDAGSYRIILCTDEGESARMACEMVKNKEAHIPMKGLMQTASFMRAILDKEAYGFVPEGSQLSQATVMEYQDRLLIATDCAVNVAPDYGEKVKIVANAVKLARKLGIQCPRVAVITPVEVVNPRMQSTIDAAMLSKAAQRGQIKNCIIDGPLGLDNAMSAEAAEHKGITSQVAGQPDILLMPDLCAGNIFTKSLTYFAHMVSSGTLNGTTVPVVMTSRTDTPEDKYYSILTAVIQGL